MSLWLTIVVSFGSGFLGGAAGSYLASYRATKDEHRREQEGKEP